MTDDEEKRQRETLSSRRLQISYRSFYTDEELCPKRLNFFYVHLQISYLCKIDLKILFVLFLLVSASVFVYGTPLVILLKYFGAHLQRRNDKFERTILVNLRLGVLDLGSLISFGNRSLSEGLKRLTTLERFFHKLH